MYRVGLEAILGFRLEGDELVIDPCIPKDWKEFSIEYQRGETTWVIEVRNPDGANRGVRKVTVDGHVMEDGRIPLTSDGGRRKVEIELGASQ
jgi:cyclic beta-1,2-glucan synthetase